MSNTDGHYFSSEPSVDSRPVRVELNLPDVHLVLDTDRGVFARGRIDPGTKALLLHGPSPVLGDRNLVDVGSGYGAIALTLAVRNPSATVWAVDVNPRALELCRANAEVNELDNVVVCDPESVPADLIVDRVWSNPPIRIGKAALHELLERWLARLGPAGTAHLVVQKHLGADSLHRWLDSTGRSTTRRRSQSAYRLLDVSASGR